MVGLEGGMYCTVLLLVRSDIYKKGLGGRSLFDFIRPLISKVSNIHLAKNLLISFACTTEAKKEENSYIT